MTNLTQQAKMQDDINNVEKIIKKYGFMAVKENKNLENLYSEVKKSDLTGLLIDRKNIRNYFFRGRLFDKGEKVNTLKEERNEKKPFLSFIQPPLKRKLNSGRFNHINNSFFYISDNKYAPYFELEKYKAWNKDKELYIQKFELKKENTNLLNTRKVDDFITPTLYN